MPTDKVEPPLSFKHELQAALFTEPFPARSAVAVKTVPKGALVEIECIAAK
jgi:2-iminobutanoate/2-iminopropanoate deaminase